MLRLWFAFLNWTRTKTRNYSDESSKEKSSQSFWQSIFLIFVAPSIIRILSLTNQFSKYSIHPNYLTPSRSAIRNNVKWLAWDECSNIVWLVRICRIIVVPFTCVCNTVASICFVVLQHEPGKVHFWSYLNRIRVFPLKYKVVCCPTI